MNMAGIPIVEHRSMPVPEYAGDAFNTAASREEQQVKSVAALLRKSATVLCSPDLRESAGAWNGTEWEEISLAVHRLSTNGVHYRWVKRLLDILIVCSFLPCLLPLLLIVAVIVRISSPGPILYRQRRIGRFGCEFELWKFRSMYVNSDEILCNHLQANDEAAREWAQSRKLKMDPRVTRLGNLLRRASLDELPQFVNVLVGDMSLVGPRPIVSAEKAQYRDAYFFYASARPGLTGLWQVSGRSNLTYHQRVALDEAYIRSWNLALDIQILWRTARVVCQSKGAV
jgi:lipopolysaccharide/colanic/teichoic acid biosynthesis glycosyltransferase